MYLHMVHTVRIYQVSVQVHVGLLILQCAHPGTLKGTCACLFKGPNHSVHPKYLKAGNDLNAHLCVIVNWIVIKTIVQSNHRAV